jgi:hypothetical protein
VGKSLQRKKREKENWMFKTLKQKRRGSSMGRRDGERGEKAKEKEGEGWERV